VDIEVKKEERDGPHLQPADAGKYGFKSMRTSEAGGAVEGVGAAGAVAGETAARGERALDGMAVCLVRLERGRLVRELKHEEHINTRKGTGGVPR
jgi:hypothetical protein